MNCLYGFRDEKRFMACLEHGFRISLKRYALSMKDKMAAGVLGALRIMGDGSIILYVHVNMLNTVENDNG